MRCMVPFWICVLIVSDKNSSLFDSIVSIKNAEGNKDGNFQRRIRAYFRVCLFYAKVRKSTKYSNNNGNPKKNRFAGALQCLELGLSTMIEKLKKGPNHFRKGSYELDLELWRVFQVF